MVLVCGVRLPRRDFIRRCGYSSTPTENTTLTALAIFLLVVLLALTAASVAFYVREGGFLGFFLSHQALQGFFLLLQLFLELLISLNSSDG